jgi:hypothetical protein
MLLIFLRCVEVPEISGQGVPADGAKSEQEPLDCYYDCESLS